MLLLVPIAHRHTPLFAIIIRHCQIRLRKNETLPQRKFKSNGNGKYGQHKKQQLLSQHNTLNLLNTTTQYTAKAQTTNHTYKKYLQYLHPTIFFIFHLIETGDETAIPVTAKAGGLPGDQEYAPSKHEENQCKQTNGTVETFVAPNKS